MTTYLDLLLRKKEDYYEYSGMETASNETFSFLLPIVASVVVRYKCAGRVMENNSSRSYVHPHVCTYHLLAGSLFGDGTRVGCFPLFCFNGVGLLCQPPSTGHSFFLYFFSSPCKFRFHPLGTSSSKGRNTLNHRYYLTIITSVAVSRQIRPYK